MFLSVLLKNFQLKEDEEEFRKNELVFEIKFYLLIFKSTSVPIICEFMMTNLGTFKT